MKPGVNWTGLMNPTSDRYLLACGEHSKEVTRATYNGVVGEMPAVPCDEVVGCSAQRDVVERPIIRIIKGSFDRWGGHVLRFVLDEVQKRLDIVGLEPELRAVENIGVLEDNSVIYQKAELSVEHATEYRGGGSVRIQHR